MFSMSVWDLFGPFGEKKTADLNTAKFAPLHQSYFVEVILMESYSW